MASTFSNGIAHADAFPSEDDHLHWLALRTTPGLGTRKAGQLIEIFRSPQAIFRASRSALEAAGLSASVAQSISSGCAFEDAVTRHQKLIEHGTSLIPLADPRYAPRLREIFDPPPVLFARGRVDLLQSLMLSIVGTRRPTAYGTAASSPTRQGSMPGRAYYRLAEWLVASTQPRTGPRWKRGGDTFAVFGCGVDEFIRLKTGSLLRRSQRKG